mmetsp:Transcript_15183/g.46342  ORF Transcript_15183/g.46342 Transcript_15183/m.46342 type:complete len:200 (+) Transcript_15183:697-1296(+)
MPVFGMCPMATKAASAAIDVMLFASAVLATTTVVSEPPASTSPPWNSLITELYMMVILGWLSTAACAALDARKVSRRWIRVTCDEVRARTKASSIAVSPPPITTTGLPAKRKPSHVAHEEMPPPLYSSSPGTPSHRESAPVARTMLWAVSDDSLVWITKGEVERSTRVTQSSANVAENFIACFFIFLMMSPPDSPSSPG